MYLRKNRLFRYLVPAVTLIGAAIGWSSPGQAFVNQFVIDQTATVNFSPIILGTSTAGPATSYTIYQGRIFGAINPNNPLNSFITDLNLASPVPGDSVPAGDVGYIANFQIVTPTNPAARSGLLIYEVSNRGGSAISTSSMIQGATYVQSGWQGDLLAECSLNVPAASYPGYPCVSLSSGPYGTLNTTTGAFTPPVASPLIPSTTNLTSYVIQVPVATTDGTPPNGTNTITGPEYSHALPGTGVGGTNTTGTSGFTAQLIVANAPSSSGGVFAPYLPVSLDTNQATLWSETSQSLTGVDTNKTTYPSTAWSWAYCPNGPTGAGYTPNPTWICYNAGFDPNQLYEITYTAANPLVMGIGYAAIRDLFSFLRYGTNAPSGGANPIAGTITNGLGIGSSQSGATLRAMTFNGANEDEDGRIVLDGIWPQIDGRGLFMNERWAQPTVLLQLYMGGDEQPVWWADYPDQARGLPPNGLLHRCTATGTCPQVLETHGELEFYGEKMGPDYVGYCNPGTPCADIPVPPADGSGNHVFRYYNPGTTHGGGSGGFTWSAPPSLPVSTTATYSTSPVAETQTNNALQYAFIGYLGCNPTCGSASIPMPPSFGGPGGTYPTIATGTLAPNTAAAVGFPSIPNVPFGGVGSWPPMEYNFGPNVNYAQESGFPTIQPPTVVAAFPSYGPVVNADGNDLGGNVPSVLFQAPLGTYFGWNPIPSGTFGTTAAPGKSGAPPYGGQQDSLTGGWWPFYETAAQRTTAGDPRLSLEERYGTTLGYKCIARVAVNSTYLKGFLLASDGTTLQTQINGTNVLTSGYTATLADTSLANDKCFRTQTHDFNGDGKSDIVWRDTSGDVAMWVMNGAAVSSSAGVGNAPTSWSIVGQRDFNGDGNADILWEDGSGDLALWLMSGASVTQSVGIGNVNPSVWSIVGIGDFNGDGKGDILWRDTGGDVAIWLMNGASVMQSCFVGNISPSVWSVVGVGDFGGTGQSDILWEDTSGDVAIWFMNGCSVTQSAGVGKVNPSVWSVAGTGDFQGDGHSGILWHDTSGDVAIWLMNGAKVRNSTGIGNASPVWSVAQTGDYFGTGYSAILWQDATGDVAVWQLTGPQTNVQSFGVGTASSVWKVQGLGAD